MRIEMIAGVVAGAMMLSACATAPSKISAAYVSPLKYQNYDCEQVGLEQANVEQRTNVLYHNLKGRNKSDKWMMGVGLIVAWPALFFLKGNNGAENTEYAQLKGDYEALRTVSVQRKCDLTFVSDLAASVAKKKPTKSPQAEKPVAASPAAAVPGN